MLKKFKLKRTGFKRSNVKTFFFFLVFSAWIWILVQFSKDYTRVLSIPVSYVNIPLDISISEDNPEEIGLQLNDNGFTFLYYKIFRPELEVNVRQAEEINNQLVYFIDPNRNEIEDQLNLDLGNSRFLTENIVINYQQKKEKKIPVEERIEVSYAVGYSGSSEMQIFPDSVTVIGPEERIDTLQRVRTLPLKLKNVSGDVQGTVKLDTAHLKNLGFYQNEVRYEQRVEKFTEGRAEVALKTRNVPQGAELAIFPKEVVVYYQVNLDDYERVEPSDFTVVCDFNDIEEGDEYLLAKIADKPEFVNNVRLSERKIQFVIKR